MKILQRAGQSVVLCFAMRRKLVADFNCKKKRRRSPAAADCKAESARGEGREVAVAADRLGTNTHSKQYFVKTTTGG